MIPDKAFNQETSISFDLTTTRECPNFQSRHPTDRRGYSSTQMATRIINVSNRLPVTVGETISKSSGGLVAALEGVSADQYELKWIGWPGNEIEADRQDEVQRVLEREHGAAAVFLTAAEAEAFYEGFANSSLWPLLHYMTNYFRYEPPWWEAYQSVNQKFAEKVLAIAREDDIVWVHDYQLMLLPAMLKQRMPSLRIGFFLHTPFPSHEIFRIHPQRAELISGILGADLIGFHTFAYLRHFRSAALRLLGIESEMTQIRHEGRVSTLGVYPIGINADKFDAELDTPQYQQQLHDFRDAFRGKQIVLSVERMDYTKGILHRLSAIDLFLREHEDRDRIKFIFVSVPSREGVEEYKELRAEVEARIGHINGTYTTVNNSPIHFIHGSVTFTQLAAFYAIASVGLITPLIDGMNLVAKEYVACQRDLPGVLVLSEFAGAAEELFNALIVNPYDTRAVADALHQALAMDLDERRSRMAPMRRRVMEFDARTWARHFITDLAARSTPIEVAASIDDAQQRLAGAIRGGNAVALFLDYDGTLREIERIPTAASPTPPIRNLLDRLRDLRNVDVTIISGRVPQDLEAWLGYLPFGLIAEHGASIRRADQREWDQLDRNVSYAWKEELLRVLRIYEESTPGSFIEDKRTSLVWHYRQADPEFGEWKAKQLATDLGALTDNQPLQIRHGRKIIEIASTHISKGAAVTRMLDEKAYDLIVCAGDDVTDESMFRLDLSHLISIKVGQGDTQAQHLLRNPAALRAFLERALQ